MQFEQHRRRGAVAHAVERGAQQRLAVGQREQCHRVGIDPQFDEPRAVGQAESIILSRPDQGAVVDVPPEPRDQQREAHCARSIESLGRMEFVQPICTQPTAERVVQPCLAERHQPHGLRCRRLRGG